MEELLSLILEIVFEVFGEVLLQLFAEGIVSLGLRITRKIFGTDREFGAIVAMVCYCLSGLVAGAVSLAIFPHPVVRPSRFRGISLLISPFCTGLVMSWLGHGLSARGLRREQIETFGYGFAFAFVMMLVRLLFAH